MNNCRLFVTNPNITAITYWLHKQQIRPIKFKVIDNPYCTFLDIIFANSDDAMLFNLTWNTA